MFGSTTGPNAPSPASPSSSAVAAFPADVNPDGTANAYDAAPADGAFVTGGGNLYSPAGFTRPRAIVPLPPVDGFAERVTVQINVLGNTIDAASVTANGVAVATLSGHGLSAVLQGTGMGASTFYTIDFRLPDAASLTLDYTSAGPSASLDVLAIDTRSTVPEPAGLAVLGFGAAALLRRRR